MKSFAIAALLCVGASSALPATLFDYGANEPAAATPGVIAVEAGSALIGTLGLGLGMGVLGVAIAGGPVDIGSPEVLRPAAGLAAGTVIGAPLGAGLATWLAGAALRQDGTLGGALVGACAGLPVTAAAAYLSTRLESYPLLAASLLAPPAGAIIGYNLSRPCRCIFGNRDPRLLAPVVIAGSDGTAAAGIELVRIRI